MTGAFEPLLTKGKCTSNRVLNIVKKTMTPKLRIIQTFVLIKCKNPGSKYFDALLLFWIH